VDIVTGTSKASDHESTGTGKDDDDTFAELETWENLEDDLAEDDRKPAAKGPPSKTRHFTPSDPARDRNVKGTKSPTPNADAANQALLAAVLSLKDKVELMETWTMAKAKKKKVKGEETDASDAEEDAGSTKGKRKEKAHTPARRKDKHTKSRGYDTESSKGEETEDTTKGLKPKGRDKSSHSTRRSKKATEEVSDHDESDSEGGSTKHRRRDTKSLGKSKSKMKGPTTKRRYYAVARGFTPGVYKNWERAKRQVDGFPDAMHKRFPTREAAEAFVKKYRKRPSRTYESLEDSLDSSSSESEASAVEKQPRGRCAHKIVQHPSIEYMAPDPSMGKDEKFFSMETADIKQEHGYRYESTQR
jgi:hypothetical protein